MSIHEAPLADVIQWFVETYDTRDDTPRRHCVTDTLYSKVSIHEAPAALHDMAFTRL